MVCSAVAPWGPGTMAPGPTLRSAPSECTPPLSLNKYYIRSKRGALRQSIICYHYRSKSSTVGIQPCVPTADDLCSGNQSFATTIGVSLQLSEYSRVFRQLMIRAPRQSLESRRLWEVHPLPSPSPLAGPRSMTGAAATLAGGSPSSELFHRLISR